MRRRLNIRTLVENAVVIGVIGIVALLIANLISFFSTRSLLPPGSRLGDVEISGLNVDDAISKTVTSLATPITLRYQTSTRDVTPEEVEFRINTVIARLQLQPVIDAQTGLNRFPGFVLRQYGAPVQVPLPFQYSEPKMGMLIGALAAQYDREARATQPSLDIQDVAAQQQGAALNKPEAANAILAALQSSITTARTMDIPVDVIPINTARVKSLEPEVLKRLKAFSDVEGNAAAVFIKDLQTGEELSLNGDVAVSAAGWLKLAVMMEAVRANRVPLSPELATHLTTISTNDTGAAVNASLASAATGDVQRGVDQVNDLLNKLGLRNTFLAQGFFQSARPANIITPANARGDINLSPDPNVQSTVADVGVLMEMLHQCKNGEGAIPLVYPEAFSEDKCAVVMDAISKNTTVTPLQAGSGNATVFHRQSWDANNHGDAALVVSPKGTYVIAMMLHSNNTLNWADTSLMMSDIARITFAFFNGHLPPAVGAQPAPPP